MSQTSEVHLTVKCGQKTAAFFPERMKQTGRTVGKCIRYQGKWMSPNEFESVAGVPAKKWKQSIRYDGKPLIEWLKVNKKEYFNVDQQEAQTSHTLTQQDKEKNVALSQDNVAEQGYVDEDKSPCQLHNDVHDNCDKGDKATCQLHDNEHGTLGIDKCNTPSPVHSEELEAGSASLPSGMSPLSENQRRSVKSLLIDFGGPNDHGSGCEALVSLVITMGGLLKEQGKRISDLEQQIRDTEARRKNFEKLAMRLLKENEVLLNEQQAELAHVVENMQSHMHSESAPVTEQEIQHGSTNTQTVGKDQLSDLQLKVESLTTRQVNLEKAQERERRKCNVIVGNVEEDTNESAADVKTKVENIFSGSLKVGCKPLHAQRIGKFHQNKTRLILVKLESPNEKLAILKAARALKGSATFIKEDLSKTERDHRRKMVIVMKQERKKGNTAFIRYNDGKLIVNGLERNIYDNSHDDSLVEST